MAQTFAIFTVGPVPPFKNGGRPETPRQNSNLVSQIINAETDWHRNLIAVSSQRHVILLGSIDRFESRAWLSQIS